MVLDDTNTRRIAIVVSGLLIWLLHTFVRLALVPLQLVEDSYYWWGGLAVMAGLTAACAYFLLVIIHQNKILSSIWLTLAWLVLYAVAEYGRYYYLTRDFAYPLDALPRMLLSVCFIPVGALGCGIAMAIAERKSK